MKKPMKLLRQFPCKSDFIVLSDGNSVVVKDDPNFRMDVSLSIANSVRRNIFLPVEQALVRQMIVSAA